MSMTEETKTYSIQLRVRRLIYEDAYVAVPVTDTIVKDNEDGTKVIDSAAFTAEAIRISHDPRVEWLLESSETHPHPIQQSIPEGRKLLDSHYDEWNNAKTQ
jgi:hypothetical protein